MKGSQLFEEAKTLSAKLIAWRRDLHQIPETDLSLPNTSAYVCKALHDMGISYQRCVNDSCITALLGTGSSPCFLLRSDMDALPVKEETGLPFASENGCMHACGHDLHTSILLGAAKLLKAHESELHGTVKLLFQPGEETFRGAKAAIEAGVLENPHVDAAFAMHVSSTVPFGVIAYGKQPMASVYGFQFGLHGHGGHGSTPERCIDPINAGVQVYLALQSLIARECPASAEAVLTIGQFSAGSAANVIPEHALLQGTLRTFDPEIRKNLIARINEIVPAVAAAYRCKTDQAVLSDVPAVLCDPKLNEQLVKAISELDEKLVLLPRFHAMGSEDFAFISELVPHSSYFALGAAHPDETKRYAQHNPKVYFAEECLPVGAASYAAAALSYLT